MAKMLPAQCDPSTASSAERRLFELLKHDPATAGWTVLHSLGLSQRGAKPYGEIDFVVMIPGIGIFCLEVKGGRIACTDGEWQTTDRNGNTTRLKRSPFMQAREGMFALRTSLTTRLPAELSASITYGYAVVIPDVTFSEVSPEWSKWQAIDREALSKPISASIGRLAAESRALHPHARRGEPVAATLRQAQQQLRPDFELVVSKAATIDETEQQLLRLTEEQFDALDLLADNARCFFDGAAGTGKTMLALEYARRSCARGNRTLLLSYNRLLGDWLGRRSIEFKIQDLLTAGSYFKLLRDVITRSSIASEFMEAEERLAGADLWGHTYDTCGRLAVEEQAKPFDVLVVDEAQDLMTPGVLVVLDAWLKGGLANGTWAFLGDFQRQAIFDKDRAREAKVVLTGFAPQHTNGRLTLNCRNSRRIGEETALLSGFSSPPYRLSQVIGPPVDYRYYDSPQGQTQVLTNVLAQLLVDGVHPSDVIVLSRLTFVRSAAAAVDGGDRFKLVEVGGPALGRTRTPAIRFSTIQAFKGLESPVVVLVDVDGAEGDEAQSLLYVGMSRARSQLTVLVSTACRPTIAACFQKKLTEGWALR